MPFNSLSALQGVLRGLRQVRPSVTAADVRYWLRRTDPALVATAHLMEPVALAVLVLTGVVLPLLAGDWTPIPTFRALHLLAGEVLVLVLVYRVAALLVQGARWLVKRPRGPPRKPRSPKAQGWRRYRDPALEAAYQVTLAVCVLSGIERAFVLSTGGPLLGLLGVAEIQALHAVAAPYFYTALLLLSYVEGRKRARALLHELRSP